jgi:hypothetical protein
VKLLSDFDGVWTHPIAEGEAQGRYLEATLLDWAPPADRRAWESWLASARSAVAAQPRRYGWAPGGKRVSAFGDEDPFVLHSALLHYLQVSAESGDATAGAMQRAILAHGHKDLDAFGGHTHATGVARVVADRGPSILPAAAAAGREMVEHGIEVVVVSNSTTDKLKAWFGQARVPFTVDPERSPGHVRLRGGGAKFILDPERAELLRIGSLEIDVTRPSYRTILEAERPDAVVGDVLSLDLALPLSLKRSRPEWRDVRLFWLLLDYTPRWIVDEVRGAAGGEIEAVEGGLAEVARRLRAG